MKRFTTIEGVFIPCLLSILGVIMYLRMGWVVGKVGLWPAIAIIVMANIITLATALSMSSIVTNIRIGTGGAHSIIAKSLGVEVGGAIGIPLYLSQAVSVAFYIAGFAEVWHSVFPHHTLFQVSLVLWFALFIISFVSAKMAFRLQYVIFGIILFSLVSVFMGGGEFRSTIGWSQIRLKEFWPVFAIFFPAVTGILAGASMSGELIDPKKSIPKGTLSAIGVSFVIYIGLAVWYGYNVPADALVANKAILLDLGRWRWLVIAGIMGATLSSALSMFIGSSRTLLALGKHSILPFSRSLTRINKKGEPTSAILFTGLLVLITLMLGTLDSVASLLTMFFLITYGMINLSMFIEQTIGIASFRPTFRIPRIIPFLGSVGCIAVMLLIDATFSLVALVAIVVIFAVLIRREIKFHSPDVRSGLLVFIAEQLAKTAAKLPYHPKIWKPNLLIPAEDLPTIRKIIPLIKAIVCPTGRTFMFSVIETRGETRSDQPPSELSWREEEAGKELSQIVLPLQEQELFVATGVIESEDFTAGSIAVMQTMRHTFFPPNTLFCALGERNKTRLDVLRLVQKASEDELGIVILKYHPEHQLGEEQSVNLWIRKQSPNIDLSILMALQLRNNWEGNVRILQAVDSEEDVLEARAYLGRLCDLMRLPADVETVVLVGNFREVLLKAPNADLNIFGMPEKPDLKLIDFVYSTIQTTILFLRDSKHESAMA